MRAFAAVLALVVLAAAAPALADVTQGDLEEAREQVRRVTERLADEVASYDASYVPRELLEEWRGKDPIRRFETRLREQGILDEAGVARVAKGIADELEAAVAWAEASPFPKGEEVEQGVYST